MHYVNDLYNSTVSQGDCPPVRVHPRFARETLGAVNVKVEVYSLVSIAKCRSPDFTHLPSGHRTCSFISHLNSPGSIQPGCHLRRTGLFQHTSLHCPTRYPLRMGQESARVGKVPCLGAQRRSIIQPSPGSNSRALTFKSHRLPLSRDAPR